MGLSTSLPLVCWYVSAVYFEIESEGQHFSDCDLGLIVWEQIDSVSGNISTRLPPPVSITASTVLCVGCIVVAVILSLLSRG
jgi:hypothetical protein